MAALRQGQTGFAIACRLSTLYRSQLAKTL